MDFLYKIEDRLLDELKEISNMDNSQPMTADCLDNIKDITDSLTNITTYSAMKSSGYSNDSGMGGYSNNGGYSYARGRNRDSMGRFSSRGGMMSRGHMMDDWGRDPYEYY